MNRFDEIKNVANRAAARACPPGVERTKMGEDLVELITLLIRATGKGVAVEGESAQNEALHHGEETPGEADAAHNRYLIGEQIQTAARTVLEEVREADLSPAPSSGSVADEAAASLARAQHRAELRDRILKALSDVRRLGLGALTEVESVALMVDAVLNAVPTDRVRCASCWGTKGSETDSGVWLECDLCDARGYLDVIRLP